MPRTLGINAEAGAGGSMSERELTKVEHEALWEALRASGKRVIGGNELKYRTALEQIKQYHEVCYGDKAKTFQAYDMACEALKGE